MEVHLPPELERLVRDLVASGRYASASEAVAAAVQLLQEEEYIRTRKLEWLQRAVQEGLDSLEKEGPVDGEKVFADLRRKITRMRKADPAKPARKSGRRAG